MEQASGSAPRPKTPAGWYPDPDQVDTVRFWDGETWTDQRAPAHREPARSSSITKRSVLGVAGAIIAAVGMFLPQLDTSTSLHIAHNSVIANEAVIGIIGLFICLAALLSAVRTADDPDRYLRLSFSGVLLLAAAIYAGTSKRLDLETTGPVIGGHIIHGSAGVGIYAIGIGGALVILAGLVRGGHEVPN